MYKMGRRMLAAVAASVIAASIGVGDANAQRLI